MNIIKSEFLIESKKGVLITLILLITFVKYLDNDKHDIYIQHII